MGQGELSLFRLNNHSILKGNNQELVKNLLIFFSLKNLLKNQLVRKANNCMEALSLSVDSNLFKL